MWCKDEAQALAEDRLRPLGRRWTHVKAAGATAERLAADGKVSDRIVVAAWLHDIGYAPDLAATGFHALDGAAYLQSRRAPDWLVALVAHHTGATYEAQARGLSTQMSALPVPVAAELDALTLVDLVTSATGQPTSVEARLAEILQRYESSDPVHQAVSRSAPHLRDTARRARAQLGLPDDWPVQVT